MNSSLTASLIIALALIVMFSVLRIESMIKVSTCYQLNDSTETAQDCITDA